MKDCTQVAKGRFARNNKVMLNLSGELKGFQTCRKFKHLVTSPFVGMLHFSDFSCYLIRFWLVIRVMNENERIFNSMALNLRCILTGGDAHCWVMFLWVNLKAKEHLHLAPSSPLQWR